MKAKDFRKIAADECRPHSGRLALMEFFLFVALLLLTGIGFIPYAGAVITGAASLLLAGPILFSEISISKKIKENTKPQIEDWFLGFKRFVQSFALALLEGIFIFLWTLLLIVPGIIKTLSYSQAKYLSHDNPELSATDSIDESRKLMVGYKWKLFCLNISYIGWILLCILTLGILSFWVAPKIKQANFAFHLNLMKERANAPVEVKQDVKGDKTIEAQAKAINKEKVEPTEKSNNNQNETINIDTTDNQSK